MTASRDELASLLYQALGEPIGLVLRTSDRELARTRLYQARTRAADPALGVLQIRVSPFPDGDLIVCKSGQLTRQTPAKPKET